MAMMSMIHLDWFPVGMGYSLELGENWDSFRDRAGGMEHFIAGCSLSISYEYGVATMPLASQLRWLSLGLYL